MTEEPQKGMGGMGANQLAGNVIVGFGLGWVVQHYFPGTKPWGIAGGVLLGAISGFYQVLKTEGALDFLKPKDKRGKPDKP
jgi:F0F1-type ATP synthase assembly protein I